MGINAELFPIWITVLFYIVWVATIIYAIISVDWTTVFLDSGLQHLFFGSILILTILWAMRAGVSVGIGIHVWGLSALTLVFGWALGVVIATCVMICLVVLGVEEAGAFGLTGSLVIGLQILTVYLIVLWERQSGNRNFFVYIFACGFFGTALAVGVAGMTMMLFYWLFHVYTFDRLLEEYIQYLPLIICCLRHF